MHNSETTILQTLNDTNSGIATHHGSSSGEHTKLFDEEKEKNGATDSISVIWVAYRMKKIHLTSGAACK